MIEYFLLRAVIQLMGQGDKSMYEYMNPVFILLGGILVFAGLLLMALMMGKAYSQGKNTPVTIIFPILVILFAVGLALHDGYSAKEAIQSNIKIYKSAKELKFYTLGETHLVSQSSGWSIRKDSFLKDTLLIRGDRCDELN